MFVVRIVQNRKKQQKTNCDVWRTGYIHLLICYDWQRTFPIYNKSIYILYFFSIFIRSTSLHFLFIFKQWKIFIWCLNIFAVSVRMQFDKNIEMKNNVDICTRFPINIKKPAKNEQASSQTCFLCFSKIKREIFTFATNRSYHRCWIYIFPRFNSDYE